MVEKVEKRDGKVVEFKQKKITDAVYAALKDTGEGQRKDAEKVSDIVVEKVNQRFKDKIPNVEDIQDLVEETLMEEGYKKTAKSYILYRKKKEILREAKSRGIGAHPKLKNFSLNAIRVLTKRYLQRDEERRIIETPSGLFERVAKTVAEGDLEYGKSKEEVEKLKKKFYDLMVQQKFMPNSPTLFNAGTGTGLTLSACFLLPIKDDLGAIFESVKNMALVQQAGGGTGMAFSRLRPRGDIVKSTGGVASGPISFMKVFNSATETIKQGGKRRGANMGILRVDHPDILDFISAKEEEGTLNNFNISVGATEEFIEAVKNDEKYELINPRNGEVTDKISARKVFDLITTMAWKNGEPGMVFLDKINKDNPVPNVGKIRGTNPCITGDTLIYTKGGLHEAEELYKNGQKNDGGVLKTTVDKRLNKERFLSSSKVFYTGRKTVYNLKTKEGYEIKLTEDHKVKTPDGWKEAKDLGSGEEILILNRKGGFGKEGNHKLGLILGWLVGDGTFSDSRAKLSFYNEEKKELAPKFAEAVNEVVDGMQRLNRKYEVGVIDLGEKAEVKSARLRRKVKEMGLVKDKFQVPKKVFRGSEDMQRGFLQALFTADASVQGSIEKGVSIRLAQSDLSLLKDVQKLLLNFGIASKIYEERRPEHMKKMPDGKGGMKDYKCKAQHELIISKENLRTFKREIGFILKRKNEELKNFLDKLKRGPYSEYFTASFEELEKIGKKKVYDLKEPRTHSFVANGIVVHNCGEVPLLPYESCNLGHVNLEKFVEEGEVKWDELEEVVKLGVHFLDNVITVNNYPIPEIEEATKKTRKVGLGVMGFANMLLQLRIPYDSEEGSEMAEKIMKFISEKSKEASEELAEERGVFPAWEGSVYEKEGVKIRNATRTTVAPTGTTSIIADTSPSIEPLFALAYRKTEILGGSSLEMINPYFREALKEEGIYSEELAKKIARAGSVEEMEEIPENLRKIFRTALDIDPKWHVKMQAAFQKYVDNSVSKTINLPHKSTPQDVSDVYMLTYDLNCKGITVYRYGSRKKQVLEKGIK